MNKLDVEEQSLRIENLDRDLQLKRQQRERHALEIDKLIAETRKVEIETRLYPYVVIGGVVSVLAALGKILFAASGQGATP